jgi:hypothetical protein
LRLWAKTSDGAIERATIHGAGVVCGCKLAIQPSGIEGSIEGKLDRVGLRFQVQLPGVKITLLDGIAAGRCHQLTRTMRAVATQVQRHIKFARR